MKLLIDIHCTNSNSNKRSSATRNNKYVRIFFNSFIDCLSQPNLVFTTRKSQPKSILTSSFYLFFPPFALSLPLSLSFHFLSTNLLFLFLSFLSFALRSTPTAPSRLLILFLLLFRLCLRFLILITLDLCFCLPP
jgi:hypothetical protein